MRYADEHEAEYPPSCHCKNERFCEAEHPVSHHGCTEPYGHTGPHIACGPKGHHHLAEWPNKFSPTRRAPRSDLGKFLFEMARDMNRAMAEQVRKEQP